MKKINPVVLSTLLFISFFFSSCEVIEGIFKTGMDFGMFIIIALIVLIVFVLIKIRKSK